MDEERILINCDCYFYFLLFLLSNNRRDEYPLLSTRASLVAQLVKKPARSARNPGSIPGWGRSPGEGNGKPLQYPYLENPMDR